MLLLDVTIVNVALPSIERDLGAGFSDLQWVIDAYALTLAGVALDFPRERADRPGRAGGRAAAVARVARPGRLRRRPPRRGAAVPGALPTRLRADPRQRGGLGERPHPQLLRWLRTAARAVRGGGAPLRRPAARPLAVPQAGLHGRDDRRLRAVGLDLLDVPLHHALLPERAGLLAVPGGAPVAAGHHADPALLAAQRPADGARSGAATARDRARVRDGRAAADGAPVRLVR